MKYRNYLLGMSGFCLMLCLTLHAQTKSSLLLLSATKHSKESLVQGGDLVTLLSTETEPITEPIVLHFKAPQVPIQQKEGEALIRIPVRIGFKAGFRKVPSNQTGWPLVLKILNQTELDRLVPGGSSVKELLSFGQSRTAQLDLSTGEIVLPVSLTDLEAFQSTKTHDITLGVAIAEWSGNEFVDRLVVPDIRDRLPSFEIPQEDETGLCHPKLTGFVVPGVTHLDDVFRVVGQYFSPQGRCEMTLRYLGDGQNPPLPNSPSYRIGPFITNEHGFFETRFSFKNPEYPTVFQVISGGVPVGFIRNHEVVPFVAGTYSLRISDMDTGCSVDREIVALGDPVLELSRPSGPFLGQVNDDPLTLTGSNFRPSSPVNIYFIHPDRGQILVDQAQTNADGGFRVLDLFFHGGGAFSLSGPTIIRVVGESGYRAETRFVIEQPRLYVSVGGEVGRLPHGNAYSELRLTGVNFPPEGNRQIRLERAPNDPRPDNERPIANAQVDRDGFFSHVVTEEEWPLEDRIDGAYQCVYLWQNALHEEAPFSLEQCLGDVHPDVMVTGIEITQGPQNLANTVPLIHRKTTWVRVYVQSELQDVGPLTCFLSATNEDGEVLTYFDGQAHQPSIRNPIPILATTRGSRRANLQETFNFRLPYHWVEEVGEVTFRARVFSRICEATEENNERSETVFFRPTVGLNVTQIRLHTHHPRQLPFEDWEMHNGEPFYNRYWDMWSALGTLPLTTHDYQMFNSRDPMEPVFHYSVAGEHFGDEYDDDIRDFDSYWALIARLNWYDMWTPDPDGQVLGPHFWYGLFPKNDGNDRGKSAGPVTRDNSLGIIEGVALGPYDRDELRYFRTRAGIVFAHEITHLIGLRHIDCNDPDDPDGNWPYDDTARIGDGTQEGTWGTIDWDGANPPIYDNGWRPVASVIAPTAATPLMGYCNNRWISDYEYALIHNRLNPFIEDWIQYRAAGGPLSYEAFHVQMLLPGAGRAAGVSHSQDVSGMRPLVETAPSASYQYFLTGLFDQEKEEVILDEFWIMESDEILETTTITETTTTTDKELPWIRLVDDTGIALLERPVRVQALSDGKGRWLMIEHFSLPEKARKLEIYNPSLSKTYQTLSASSEAPNVSLTEYPYGLVSGPATLGVMATDNDSDVLSMMIQFSSDGGGSWKLVSGERAQDVFGNVRFQIDTTALPHTTEGMFRVLASDGFHTSISEMSFPFFVPNHEPSLSISSPRAPYMVSVYDKTDPVPVEGGEDLLFGGNALDVDGTVPDEAMIWMSDVNGYLGSGREVHTRLVPGRHRITLQVRDEHGAETEKSFVMLIRGSIEREDDADRDGIPDLEDPFPKHAFWKTDVDKDGMADEWELMVFGGIQTAGLTSDFDRDGILDVVEFDTGTSPRLFNLIPQEPDPLEPTFSKPEFHPGWNMVSGASLNMFESFTAAIGESGADMILGYRAQDQVWVKVYMADDLEIPEMTEPPFDDTAGYWVHVSGNPIVTHP